MRPHGQNGINAAHSLSTLAFIVCAFDPGRVPQDRPGPAGDRLTIARLDGIALRHARWGALDDDAKAAGSAELREVAGGRSDLLAEVAGLELGASGGKGPEYELRARAVTELCRLAGADEDAIPAWIEEGKRRAEIRRHPPFSSPGRTPRRPSERLTACPARGLRSR
jgi:hypothetical protein